MKIQAQRVVTVDFDGWREYCEARGLLAAALFNEESTARTDGLVLRGRLLVQAGCTAAYIPVRFVRYADEGKTE